MQRPPEIGVWPMLYLLIFDVVENEGARAYHGWHAAPGPNKRDA